MEKQRLARRPASEIEVRISYNRLIGLFLFVAFLLGMSFALGYYVGTQQAKHTESASLGDSPNPPGPPSALVQDTKETEPNPPPTTDPAEATARASTTGSHDETDGSPAPPSPHTALFASSPESTQPQPFLLVQPKPGQVFLQVAAQNRANAQLVASVLKSQGFPVIVAPGPKQDLFRVLVGPLTSREQINRTRTQLQKAGFQPILRKY